MTDNEKQLLDNALDALDRLFDRHSSVSEVSLLLSSTAEALRDTGHYTELVVPADALRDSVLSGADNDWDHALEVTNRLRLYLARLLPLN